MDGLVLQRMMYLMQGTPGSGKSVMARVIAESESVIGESRDSVIILSTDDERRQECGHYIHDVTQNRAHHQKTQRLAIQQAQRGTRVIIIDNTNITLAHATPYITIANIFGYTPTVVRVDPGLKEALRRNASRDSNRRVPDEVVIDFYERMENLL